MAVSLSQDPVGIKEILGGEDTHSKNQEAFQLPSRLIAKIFLFRTIFRGSGWAFANDNDFKHVSDSPEFWNEKNAQFYKKYAGLDKWHHSLAQLCASKKPIVGFSGREWLVVPKFNERSKQEELPWPTFTNFPVQGSGADLMMLARISMLKRMKTRNMKSILISTVHDSIVADCPDEEVEEIHLLFHEVFSDLQKNVKKVFNYDLPVPFPCETKFGVNMKEMEKFKQQPSMEKK